MCPSWGFLLWRGPCNARGPLVSWTGSQCGPAALWLRGPFCPPVFGLFGAWLLGVDMTAAVAPFLTLFLPIKSPPLSTDRDTGMHMISLPMVTIQHNIFTYFFNLSSLRLCPPTEITSLLCCLFQISFFTRFLPSSFKCLSFLRLFK